MCNFYQSLLLTLTMEVNKISSITSKLLFVFFVLALVRDVLGKLFSCTFLEMAVIKTFCKRRKTVATNES